MELVWNLPEIKAWMGFIERKSDGRSHAVVMINVEDPVKEDDGRLYWPVGFLEDTGPLVHRWETFLVRADGSEIMIENDVDPAAGMLTLDRWRKERKPMEKSETEKSEWPSTPVSTASQTARAAL